MKKNFKNISTQAALFIALAAFSACSSEDSEIISELPTIEQTPQVYNLTIDASMGNDAQMRALELDGTKLVAKWANDETVDVRFGPTLLGTMTVSNASADGKTCTLSGTLTGSIYKGDVLRLYYNYFTGTVNESQTGTLASAAENDYALAAVTVSKVDGDEITLEQASVNFQNQVAMLKITMKDGSDNKLNATKLEISGDNISTITFSPTAATYTENGNGVLYFAMPSAKTLASANSTETDVLATMAVTFTATVGGDTYTATKTGYPFAAGKYYATTLTMAEAGVFSVSNTKKVYFSKGNLRYASGTWSFFDHQYDYDTSYSADAWDKFGWSTSANTYGMSTSQTPSDYSGDFVDWGATMGTGWRTLTSDEWTYLFNTRSASTVGSTANGRYAKGKVNDVQGIILFPDTYTHPDGVTAPVGVNATDDTGWNGNNYSSADWTKMESAGCVFLPAAGYRNGSQVNEAGAVGLYRSATPNGSDYAYYVEFLSSGLNPAANTYVRGLGFSVRLVKMAN